MWRSFFYAVGIGLFLLGGQALVTDHVVVPKNNRLQKLITKVFSDGDAATPAVANSNASGTNGAINDAAGGLFQGRATNNAGNAFAGNPAAQAGNYGYDTGSRYGPSRFSGPAFGGYGGARLTPQQQQQQNFSPRSNAQTQAQAQAQLAAYRGNGAPARVKPRTPMQQFKIREWMPWSLLAAGSIIFLYTHSLRGRNYSE